MLRKPEYYEDKIGQEKDPLDKKEWEVLYWRAREQKALVSKERWQSATIVLAIALAIIIRIYVV